MFGVRRALLGIKPNSVALCTSLGIWDCYPISSDFVKKLFSSKEVEDERIEDFNKKLELVFGNRSESPSPLGGHQASRVNIKSEDLQQDVLTSHHAENSFKMIRTPHQKVKAPKELMVKLKKSSYRICAKMKPRALEYNKKRSGMSSADTTSEALAVLKNRLELGYAKSKQACGYEAYRLFLKMRQEGFEPNAITYLSILNASASAGPLEWLKEVHGHASKAGLESDVRVGNALVHMYAKIGRIDDARLVFDRMEIRNLVTWSTMIGGLAKDGCGHEAYRLFLKMRQEGFEPNAITYTSILNASASAGALEWVKEVHGHARKAGLESDVRLGSALVHMYAKIGSIDDARLVFDRMETRDIYTWTVMIGGLAQHGCGHEAYRLFLKMRQEGFEPNVITYTSILNASASAGALEWVKDVHDHASKAGLESDVRLGNALVHIYAKSGSIDDARVVFDRMEKRDVVTWTTMMGGLAEHGRGHEALDLFREMIACGVKPDGTSFVAVFSACCHAGLFYEGRRLFLAMKQNYGIEPDIVHYTCMVDLIGRSGNLEEAKLFIGDMPVEPDAVTWGAFLGACRTYGHVELGELAAKELLKLKPDDSSAYVLLSNIYAAAGKWEKVSFVRTMMQQKGVRKEPGRSWIEVDNKIHEFVVGDLSHPEAKAIYTVLNRLTEKLKTEGYAPDTRLVLQNIDEEDKELALCSHSEKLAIAYGLIRIPRGKPIRVWKNLRVCSDCHAATKLISKVTGREIIARDANRFHHFKGGVCSCGDYW
ncbi:unnamed protein product [Calypogeia fissa]